MSEMLLGWPTPEGPWWYSSRGYSLVHARYDSSLERVVQGVLGVPLIGWKFRTCLEFGRAVVAVLWFYVLTTHRL